MPLLRQLLRVRQLLRGVSRAGDRQAGEGPVLRVELDLAPGVPRASNSARALPSRWCRAGVESGPRAHGPRECPPASRSARRRARRLLKELAQAAMKSVVMDGNTAAAHIAYRVNEVCAIFPITPSSTMAELADAWAARASRTSGARCRSIQQMQSEGGAAGRGARRAAERRAHHDVHGVAGIPADAAQHVQDRGRADALRLSMWRRGRSPRRRCPSSATTRT